MLRFLVLASLLSTAALTAEALPDSLQALRGDWTLDLPDQQAGWLSIRDNGEEPTVCMLWYVGTIKPLQDVTVRDGSLEFTLRKKKDRASGKWVVRESVSLSLEEGTLRGILTRIGPKDGPETVPFTGTRLPPMPPRPNLSTVRFGKAQPLFNGKDLTGWIPSNPAKINGWSVRNGELVNDTPKTDFSALGAYANLRTEDEFLDFKLHLEFNIGAKRNSGVYLRGLYEAQIVDRDSPMQGIQGPGAIFGRIAPSENAGKPGGEWQTYDLTLVDRHVTVTLNGKTVIDNQPVPGPTGGALQSDVTKPGPIYLQGDHTSVRFRNITLTPVLR